MQRLLHRSYGNVTEKYDKNVVPIEFDQPVVVQVGFYVSDMMPLVSRDKVRLDQVNFDVKLSLIRSFDLLI